ncbi:hypothetical protein PoB_004158600 [Plakobranchus ocellatus]|uniref:Uncharacterized protein n=1 Tax=Plakobranchus ocellatus TaxID=259542 RepID=A0AAV4B3P0_9GAST|nr:hypothetical protein PoB_004158600 [Plakobranchus ocellatus]
MTNLLSPRAFFIIYSGLLIFFICAYLYMDRVHLNTARTLSRSEDGVVTTDQNSSQHLGIKEQTLNKQNQGLGTKQSLLITAGGKEKSRETTKHEENNSELDNEDSALSMLVRMLRETLDLPNDAVERNTTRSCGIIDYSINAYQNHKPCVGAECKIRFNRTLDERLEDVLLSPQYQLTRRQLDAILSLARNVPEVDTIIASAASSSHYDEMQMMFKNLHFTVIPKLTNFHIVLFDIGLSQEERLMTESKCRCQVINFDFSLFPQHVADRHCYAWKPLLIRAMFARARKLVVWQDASVRWGQRFKVILQRTQVYGLQVFVGNGDKVTANTLHEMFEYMEEEECLFEWVPEICNAVAVYRTDNLNRRAIVNPWSRCALERSCICPQEPATCRRCSKLRPKRCHRFDQSALTLLLGKIYYDQRYKIEIPEAHKHVEILRGTRAPNFFMEQSN